MTIIYAIILLGVLIFVHELGHFIFAKLADIKVDCFSLGFGPKLVGFKRGETEYCISAFPLGGYVKMLGEDPDEEIDPKDRGRAFTDKSKGWRAIILVAGPMFNLILPIIIYFFYFWGIQQYPSTHINVVIPGKPAFKAGLQPGDQIMAVQGKEVKLWSQLTEEIGKAYDQDISLRIKRGDEILAIKVKPETIKAKNVFGQDKKSGKIGVSHARLSASIGITSPNSLAFQAGLRTFDLVKEINGQPVEDFFILKSLLAANKDDKISFKVERASSPPKGQIPKNSPQNQQDIRKNAAKVEDSKSIISLDLVIPPDLSAQADRSPDFASVLGIESSSPYIFTVQKGTLAAQQGLLKGDRLISLNGQPIQYWWTVEEILAKNGNHQAAIKFRRAGQLFSQQFSILQKEKDDKYGRRYQEHNFGARGKITFLPGEMIEVKLGPLEAAAKSFNQAFRVMEVMLKAISFLISGDIPLKSLGGPIMIFDIAGKAAREGWSQYLWIMALISINLGLLNLFPIPVLDGGHLLLLGVEVVTRKPLSMKIRQVTNTIGITLLFLLMLFAFVNDIKRYWNDIIGYFQ